MEGGSLRYPKRVGSSIVVDILHPSPTRRSDQQRHFPLDLHGTRVIDAVGGKTTRGYVEYQ